MNEINNFEIDMNISEIPEIPEIQQVNQIRRRRRFLPLLSRRNLFEFNNVIIDRLRIKFGQDADFDELNILLNSNKNKINDLEKNNKNLEKYKENYFKIMDNLPTETIKYIVKENKCAICLEEKTEIDKIFVITTCLHLFHEDCLNESMILNKRCPICRVNLSNSYCKKFEFGIINKDTDFFD